jgi:hypothetical protein
MWCCSVISCRPRIAVNTVPITTTRCSRLHHQLHAAQSSLGSSSANQEITRIVQNLKPPFRVYRSPWSLSWATLYFSSVLPSHLRLHSRLSFRGSYQNPVCISLPSHACSMSHPSCSASLYDPNMILSYLKCINPFNSCLLGRNTLLSTQVWNNLSLLSISKNKQHLISWQRYLNQSRTKTGIRAGP